MSGPCSGLPILALSALLLVACEGRELAGWCGDHGCAADDEGEREADDGTAREEDVADEGEAEPPPGWELPTFDPETPANSSASPKSGAHTPLPCAVQAVVRKYCGTCHGAQPSAPMSLLSVEDFAATSSTPEGLGKTVLELAKIAIHSSEPTVAMPKPGIKPAFSDPANADGPKDKKILDDWLNAGAPAGDVECDAPAAMGDTSSDDGAEIDTSGMTCKKLLASDGRGGKFKVGVQKDGYFNATFESPWKSTVYAYVIRPVIDNRPVLHHWQLFSDPSASPSPPVPGIGAHPAAEVIHGWAPGGEPLNLTDIMERGADGTVGIELTPGNYTVEYHYNSNDPNALDASGVEICYTAEKPKHVAGLSWLGSDNGLFFGPPKREWKGTCTPEASEPITIISVSPHMHVQGRHMKSIITRANGTTEPLHDMAFDFETQVTHEKFVQIFPGDSIQTTCTFAKPMQFGGDTNQEMCYLLTMAYPKGALVHPLDVISSVAHGGGTCLSDDP